MFIAHGQRLRKYAPWILAGVLIVLLPGFVLLFAPAGGAGRGKPSLPSIGGKDVNPAEFQQAQGAVMAQYIINTGRPLPRTAQFEDQLKQESVIRMVLLRKAQEFGIRVSDDEVVRQIRNQPIFQGESGQFEPELYRRYVIYLNNFGVSESQFEHIMREQFAIQRLRSLVSSAVIVTPEELRLAYTPLHEKTAIDLVRFDMADHQESTDVTDEEAQTYFDRNREAFRKPAQVKVRYVYFSNSDAKNLVTLTEEEIAEYYERNKSGYTDPEKGVKALDEVATEIRDELTTLRGERLAGDRATEFSVKLVHEYGAPRPDFAKIAGELGFTPQETEFFGLRDSVEEVKAGPQFNQVAFSLSHDLPFSDPISGEDGYYVLEYLESKRSEVPPFAEAKEQVIDRLKRQRAYEATVSRGRDSLARVRQAMAAGKSFSEACSEVGLTVESPRPFSFTDATPELPAANNVKEIVLGMATDAVSEFVPTANGGVFFHLKHREAPDAEQFEKDREQFERQLQERNRQALFQDWISSLVQQERIDFGQQRAQPQPIEPEEASSEEVPLPASG